MKKGIHSKDYRPVVVQDTNSGFMFLTRMVAKTDETIKYKDGKEYPLFKVHISSASHPFYTGEEKIVDVEGRVDRFKARQAEAEKRRKKLAKTAKNQPAGKKKKAKNHKIGEKLGAKSQPKRKQ